MKPAFTFLAVSLLFASCSKPDPNGGTGGPGIGDAVGRAAIPNWNNDVLYGTSIDVNPSTGLHDRIDSIIAMNIAGNSKIQYRGIVYDIWIDTNTVNHYSPYTGSWIAHFGPSINLAGATGSVLVESSLGVASPGDTVHQKQRIYVENSPVFTTKVKGDDYRGK